MTNVRPSRGDLIIGCYRALDLELGLRIRGPRHTRVFRALAALEVRSARRRHEGDVAELPVVHSWSAP